MDNCTQCIWSGKCSTEGSGLNCNEFTARTEPDAPLIATAPDLLEACSAARELIELVQNQTPYPTLMRDTVKQLDAAIAKAEGGAQ